MAWKGGRDDKKGRDSETGEMGFHVDHLFFIPLIISVTGRRVKRRPRETILVVKPSREKFIWPERYPTTALAERVRPAALAPLRRPAPELR